MPDDNASGGNGSGGSPKNEGEPHSNTNKGQDEWKAKYEAEKSAHAETQKQIEKKDQEVSLHRNRATELQGKLDQAVKDKETALSDLTNLKDTTAKAEAKKAAEAKQAEILSPFSDHTKELVKDLGLELPDAEDEAAVKAFTEKIQKLEDKKPEGDGAGGDDGKGTKKPNTRITGNNGRPESKDSGKPKSEQESVEELEKKVENVTF